MTHIVFKTQSLIGQELAEERPKLESQTSRQNVNVLCVVGHTCNLSTEAKTGSLGHACQQSS